MVSGSVTTIPTSCFDPNVAGIMKFYPDPNATPSPGNGWNNYTWRSIFPRTAGKVPAKLTTRSATTPSWRFSIPVRSRPISIPSRSGGLQHGPCHTPRRSSPRPLRKCSWRTSPTCSAPRRPTSSCSHWRATSIPAPWAIPTPWIAPSSDSTCKDLFGHTTKQIPHFLGSLGRIVPRHPAILL